MILRTWSGSHIDTRDYTWRVWFHWAQGWCRFLLRERLGETVAVALLILVAVVVVQLLREPARPAEFNHDVERVDPRRVIP